MASSTKRAPHVLICGGGRAVHVMASMAARVFPTSIISLNPGEAEKLKAGGYQFSCNNDLGVPYEGMVEIITDDPAEVSKNDYIPTIMNNRGSSLKLVR
jgi:hypothetical protein